MIHTLSWDEFVERHFDFLLNVFGICFPDVEAEWADKAFFDLSQSEYQIYATDPLFYEENFLGLEV